MAEHNARPPIVAVCGPTATGKTEIAIRLAHALDGEIVCADSMQIYDKLTIGTARPTADELARAPHHLFGTVDPARSYSVSDYVADAGAVIDRIAARGKTPILCGGTGLYIRALVSGVRFAEAETDLALRAQIWGELEQNGAQALLDEIARTDPDTAAALHPNNGKRIVRTVELLRITGRSLQALNIDSLADAQSYPCAMLVLYSENRSFLYDRIERRVDQMLAQGLLDEARLVYDNREWYKTAAQAIGYKDFFPYFEQTASLEDCIEALKQATRRYAKRQITWFRRDPDAVWQDIETQPVADILDAAVKKYREITHK